VNLIDDDSIQIEEKHVGVNVFEAFDTLLQPTTVSSNQDPIILKDKQKKEASK
jgi:hypothetical protein